MKVIEYIDELLDQKVEEYLRDLSPHCDYMHERELVRERLARMIVEKLLKGVTL